MGETELLVNCRNRQIEERPLEQRAVLTEDPVVAAREKRREMALAYLRSRTIAVERAVAPLTTMDLRELLILLGLDE